MFCFKEYNFFIQCHFTGSFFFLKNLDLVPPHFLAGTAAPPVRFLYENLSNFFLSHFVYSHINVDTQWVSVIFCFRKFITIDENSFYISQLPISCGNFYKSDAFNSCIVLSNVDVSFIYLVTHLYYSVLSFYILLIKHSALSFYIFLKFVLFYFYKIISRCGIDASKSINNLILKCVVRLLFKSFVVLLSSINKL